MAVIARDHRAGELDRMERECRYRLGQANLRYNEALVRASVSLIYIWLNMIGLVLRTRPDSSVVE